MNAPAVITLTAAGLLLYASRATSRGYVEAGQGGGFDDVGAITESFSWDNLIDNTETAMNIITEAPAHVAQDLASQNAGAFLGMLRFSEGTDRALNPWACVFGYALELQDLSDHPAITGEWRGARLPDQMCINAGFRPGCVSTAAGAYQIIRPTWVRVRDRLGLPDFSQASQDAAALELVRSRGALQDVYAGRIEAAISKCRQEWASLPGNSAKQGQRAVGDLLASFTMSGGVLA